MRGQEEKAQALTSYTGQELFRELLDVGRGKRLKVIRFQEIKDRLPQ
jgi:hypothetical protein